jgi:hypothetical protein
MKKNLLSVLFIVLGCSAFGQVSLFETVRTTITRQYPELRAEEKLIVINFWSANDPGSRELNEAFNKNYSIYKFARLKGGRKGMIAVAVNTGNDASQATITLRKDGALELLPLTIADTGLSEAPFKNAVFDSEGNRVYTDLVASEVFMKINQLLTR